MLWHNLNIQTPFQTLKVDRLFESKIRTFTDQDENKKSEDENAESNHIKTELLIIHISYASYAFDFGVIGSAIAQYTRESLLCKTLNIIFFADFFFFFWLKKLNIIFCSLENWYYRILFLMTGYLKNATTAVDALSIWYNLFIFLNP